MNTATSEEALCHRLSTWLRTEHPDLVWHFDFGSGLKMTMNQARRQKALNTKSYPDLFIATSATIRGSVDHYCGLFIELKKDGVKLTKRDGSPVSDHVHNQALVLDQLRNEGYFADFAIGYDEAQRMIENYLGGRL